MISDIIKELRMNKQMTQRELANILHVTPQTIRNYEKGIDTPDLDILIMISTHFLVSTDFLLGLTSQKDMPIDFGTIPDNIKESMILLINALRNKYSDSHFDL